MIKWQALRLNPSSSAVYQARGTIATPNVSHFPSVRGNTGKSTARIARMVTIIICARYVVNAASGETGIGSMLRRSIFRGSWLLLDNEMPPCLLEGVGVKGMSMVWPGEGGRWMSGDELGG